MPAIQLTHSQPSLMIGANDTAGGLPHRHATIDGNGRLMTYPYEHPNSWTNVRLEGILLNQTNGTQISNSVRAFDAVVVLKDNEAIAGSYTNDTTGKKGQVVSLQVISHSATTAWTCSISQSIDNSNWTTTTDNINSMASMSQLTEVSIVAPYWRLTLANTSGGSANFSIKYL